MKSSYRNSLLICGVFVAAAAALPKTGGALDLAETTPLNFGELAIVSYGAVGTVTLNPSGTFSNNANIAVLSPPQLGEYLLTNAPISSFYTITLPASVDILGPGGPFTLDNLEYRPLVLVTDGAGSDTFTISGRLSTLGGGTPYGDGTYTTNFTVTFAF